MQDYTNYTKEEFIELYDRPLDELLDIAEIITKSNFGNTIETCSIISAKTGACTEDCKYCSQSNHNQANIVCSPLLDVQTVKKAALSARQRGASHFCIVTSGRKPSETDFAKILKMIKEVSAIKGINCCASCGLLSKEQLQMLKRAGAKRYNHNINTSENYYKNICTTHDFEDRLKTVKAVKECGLEACCGVIIGMGETRADRVDMALSLRKLNPKTVPINILNPIKGTPLEDFENKINEDEVLKTICIFRIILPQTLLRYAGGRTSRLDRTHQKLGFIAGINSMLVGNYLTTLGSNPDEDRKILSELDRVISKI